MYWNLVESYFHGERGNGVVYRLRRESERIISESLTPNSQPNFRMHILHTVLKHFQ